MKKFDFKKIICLVLVFALLLTFAACNKDPEPEPEPTPTPTPTPAGPTAGSVLSEGITGVIKTVDDVIATGKTGKIGYQISAALTLPEEMGNAKGVYSVDVAALLDLVSKDNDGKYNGVNQASVLVKKDAENLGYVSLSDGTDKLSVYIPSAGYFDIDLGAINLSQLIGYTDDGVAANPINFEYGEAIAGIVDSMLAGSTFEKSSADGVDKLSFTLAGSDVTSLLATLGLPLVDGLLAPNEMSAQQLFDKVFVIDGKQYDFDLATQIVNFNFDVVLDFTLDSETGIAKSVSLKVKLGDSKFTAKEVEKYEYKLNTKGDALIRTVTYAKDKDGNEIEREFSLAAQTIALDLSFNKIDKMPAGIVVPEGETAKDIHAINGVVKGSVDYVTYGVDGAADDIKTVNYTLTADINPFCLIDLVDLGACTTDAQKITLIDNTLKKLGYITFDMKDDDGTQLCKLVYESQTGMVYIYIMRENPLAYEFDVKAMIEKAFAGATVAPAGTADEAAQPENAFVTYLKNNAEALIATVVNMAKNNFGAAYDATNEVASLSVKKALINDIITFITTNGITEGDVLTTFDKYIDPELAKAIAPVLDLVNALTASNFNSENPMTIKALLEKAGNIIFGEADEIVLKVNVDGSTAYGIAPKAFKEGTVVDAPYTEEGLMYANLNDLIDAIIDYNPAA